MARTMTERRAARPEHLKRYVEVTGHLEGTPLDFPARWARFLAELTSEGWLVAVEDVGTDFGEWFPTPSDLPRGRIGQPFILLVAYPRAGATRADGTPYSTAGRPYTEDDAKRAVRRALDDLGYGYSTLGSWISEVYREVIAPTARQLADPWGGPLGKWLVPVLVGLGLVALIQVASAVSTVAALKGRR